MFEKDDSNLQKKFEVYIASNFTSNQILES